MTGKTHQLGGELSAVLGFVLLKEKGLLLSDANLYLQLVAMYPFTLWGAKALDLDHHGDALPMHDVLSVTLSRVLHLTYKPYKRMKTKLEDNGVSPSRKRKIRRSFWYKFCKWANASHRSWQTHSELTFFVLVAVLWWIFNLSITETTNIVLLYIMIVGAGMGMLSHLVLDALTSDGIPLVLFRFVNLTLLGKSKLQLPERLHLVPKSGAFSCESNWESFISKLLRLFTVVSVVYLVIILEYPELPHKLILWIYSLIK